MLSNNLIEHFSLNEPTVCDECGGEDIKYDGIGEYHCVDCGHVMFDDYGKVRNYLEQHVGATANEVSLAVKVSKEKIRRLLREDKIQIAPGSATFLSCEICGADIRSGRLCQNCLDNRNRASRLNDFQNKKSNVTGGFGKSKNDGAGAKRFDRK